MRRKIIYATLFLSLVAGFGACYLDNFYDYKSVFILPQEKESRIPLTDSLFIYPNLTIESHIGTNGNQIMAAYISFGVVPDSISVKSINIEISCTDNPQQYIYLTHVITYVDPLIPEHIDYVSAHTFDELPEHYKTVTLEREPWTTFRFYFETKNIDLGNNYNCNIYGTVFYKGKYINFKKNVQVKRKKKFVPSQMMT